MVVFGQKKICLNIHIFGIQVTTDIVYIRVLYIAHLIVHCEIVLSSLNDRRTKVSIKLEKK